MPTALELSRERWKPYLEAARRREPQPDLSSAERAERQALLDRVRTAAAELRRQFGVRRVILFGSLAHEAWYEPDSDVDLAVEGLQTADYWRAWRLVEEAVSDRQVDLVEMETARESLRKAIERHGIEL